MDDVAIMGGGPAGSVAAIAIARRGWRVALVEQRRFPRDKVCGECLSGVGIDVLEQLQAAETIRRLGAVLLHRMFLHSPGGASCELRLPRTMWGISRAAMDEALLLLAREAGAEVIQPARCEGISAGAEPVARIRNLEDNIIHELTCRRLVLADGKGSFLPTHGKTSGDLGVAGCFEGIDGPAHAIELFGTRGSYGGLAPIENGRWNAAFNVPAWRIARHQGSLDKTMAEMTCENATLAKRMGRAIQIGKWIASPLPRFPVQRHWPLGLIPIGNAAAALEPIGGEGMGLAMRSAMLAADFLDADLRHGGVRIEKLRQAYQHLWRRRRLVCRLGIMASNPAANRLLVGVASASHALSTIAMRAAGKTDRFSPTRFAPNAR